MKVVWLPVLLLAFVSNTMASANEEFDTPAVHKKEIVDDGKVHSILVQFCTS